jgi:hypothetical protein
MEDRDEDQREYLEVVGAEIEVRRSGLDRDHEIEREAEWAYPEQIAVKAVGD